MDARPQRPLRCVRINDENAPPQGVAGKVIHHRNKSTPALIGTLEPWKGIKAAPAKRTAFADVSNTLRQPLTKHDIHLPSKSSQLEVLKDPAVVPAKEVQKSATLLKAPQRPLGVNASKMNASIITTAVPPIPKHIAPEAFDGITSAPIRKTLNKKPTTIFKERCDPVVDIASFPVEVAHLLDGTRKPVGGHSKAKSYLEHGPVAVEAVEEEPLHQALPKVPYIEPLAQQLAQQPIPDVPAYPEPKHASVVTKASTIQQQAKVMAVQVEVTEQYEYLDALEEQVEPADHDRKDEVTQAHAVTRLDQEEYWDEDDEEEYYDADGYTTARSLRSRGDNTTGGVTLVLAPRVTAKSQRELEAAKQYVEAHKTVEDIEDEQWDISMVAEYGDEIFEYMRTLEDRMTPNASYMDHQAEIQWSMRSVLMDWLVQVHNRFALLPETLFLSVNYVDRFLSCKVVSLGKLQLVGATALFLAAKYEEIQCPSVQEMVYMVDNAYTIDEILKAERFMLSMLNFELGWPGPMSFLRRISKADEYDLETRTLAKYFLELTIMDERFVGCTPSFLAAGAHCLARLMLKKGDWTQSHVHYSGYTLQQLRQLVMVILECCDNPRKHHGAIFDKYTEKRYKRASIFVETELAKGFQLPFASRDSFAGHGLIWKRK
ncbi:uncharacterized protein EI97DRAFT_215862 [Westerdykella ornata]|uniref:Uncharacterized protein n=1 Tax=Westerdykella ornata TaxID=318751 RepID=A0A6A6JRC1_WESOR|nr:uncharacterized protein EI97DRAFT_215862 [Westerdykella ornata]KAF2278653.1 hypothetical protein EI97DRAFT_215862 [Westerdykella ornata]